jgi:outer membrane protein assembly factor BamB
LLALNPDGTLKWRRLLDEAGMWTTPALGADGAIYIGSNFFYALHPDGAIRWRFERVFTGSSAALGADGTIYFGTWIPRYLIALNPDGTLKWFFETGYEVYSSPAIGADGTIYFGSRDHYFYALNPTAP